MKKFTLFAFLLLIALGLVYATPAAKRLNVTYFTYEFEPNFGIGENGFVTLGGPGFGGGTTMGTGGPSGGWTVSGNNFTPGQIIYPAADLFTGYDQGTFTMHGINYVWPLPTDPLDPTNYVRANFELVGESFTFPPISSTASGLWQVEVPAKIHAMDGNRPTMTFGTWPTGTETTLPLQIRPGRLTLTWVYAPAGNYCPDGCYQFVSGHFSTKVKHAK